MKRYEYNYGKNPEGALSTISGYATETTNFGETAFGILNKSTRDEENFTTPEVVSSSTATLFSVGNGTDHDSRKNIIELKADGTVYISGVGQYDGTNPGEATSIADEFQGIHDDITGVNEDIDRIDNTIESIHISEDNENLIYTLLVDGQERGTINIPRDQFLKNVSYNEETNNLEFTFIVRGENNEEVEKQINVNMTDLEDIYSAGDGLNLENKQFSVKVDADTQPYIGVSSNGVKIIGINEALDKKVSWDESKKVITLPADGSISALRNNGLEGGVLVCQRTYDEGATYVTEVGTTKNNLTLNSIERPKIDFADGTSQNVAYESEVKSLQDRMSTAETDIDNLEGRMDTAESDIDTIQSDLGELTGDGEGSVQDQIKTALEDYLPLSGGTITGPLGVNRNLTVKGSALLASADISAGDYVGLTVHGDSVLGGTPGVAVDASNIYILNNVSNAGTGSEDGMIISKEGISISDKTEQDLLNAAGGTTSVDSIKEGLATEDALNEYKTSNDAEIAALKSKDIELSSKIDSIHIPSKVSELENDSKYQTEDQVNSRMQAVVGAAPEALDTLKEIGDALGNDPDFAATMTNKLTEINSKIGSNTYTGANYISKETNLTDTVMQLDEEIKATNDNLDLEHANAEATYAKKTDLSGYLPLTGGTLTGQLDGTEISADILDVGRVSMTGDDHLYIDGIHDSNTYLTLQDSNNNIVSIGYNGIKLPNKTTSDLLNAGGTTTPISDIISQVTVPTKVSELTNDSGYQTESQVAAKVSALVDSAPETLDTLNELAAALGDDPNFATTVTNQIAQKADKTTATTSADGLMSAADKTNLDNLVQEIDTKLTNGENGTVIHLSGYQEAVQDVPNGGYVVIPSDSNDLGGFTAGITMGAPDKDGGFMTIYTKDNGNEPIYVAQYDYNGISQTGITHYVTLMDASGNQKFNNVTATGYSILNGAANEVLTADGDRNTLKTINGQTLLGSGDIDLSSYATTGSLSGYLKVPTTEETGSASVDNYMPILGSLNNNNTFTGGLYFNPNTSSLKVANTADQLNDYVSISNSGINIAGKTNNDLVAAGGGTVNVNTLATQDDLENYVTLSTYQDIIGGLKKIVTSNATVDNPGTLLQLQYRYTRSDTGKYDYEDAFTFKTNGYQQSLLEIYIGSSTSDVCPTGVKIGLANCFDSIYTHLNHKNLRVHQHNDHQNKEAILDVDGLDVSYKHSGSTPPVIRRAKIGREGIYLEGMDTYITISGKTTSDLLNAAGGTTTLKTINGESLLGSGDITTPTPTVNAASGTKTIWTGTQSEYEAVSTKDANTLYFITEG